MAAQLTPLVSSEPFDEAVGLLEGEDHRAAQRVGGSLEAPEVFPSGGFALKGGTPLDQGSKWLWLKKKNGTKMEAW